MALFPSPVKRVYGSTCALESLHEKPLRAGSKCSGRICYKYENYCSWAISGEIQRGPPPFGTPPSRVTPKKLRLTAGAQSCPVRSRPDTRQPVALTTRPPIPHFPSSPPPTCSPSPPQEKMDGWPRAARLSQSAYSWDKGAQAPNQKFTTERNLKFGKIYPAVSLQTTPLSPSILSLSVPPQLLKLPL